MTNKGVYNYRIEGYRAVLILWIVLFHYTVRYNSLNIGHLVDFPVTFPNGGLIGTNLFFMLSGYYMCSLFTNAGNGWKGYVRYCLSRYLRLWPGFVLALCIIALWLIILPLPNKEISVSRFLTNALMVVPPKIHIDLAHWFLSALVVTQCLAALLLFIKKSKTRAVVCFFFFFVFFSIVCASYFKLGGLEVDEAIDRHIWGAFCVFGGMIMGLPFMSNIKIFTTVLFVIFMSWVSPWYLIYILLFVLLQSNYLEKPMSILFSNALMRFVGKYSFCWYLLHQSIGYTIIYYYVPQNEVSMVWLLFPCFITFVLAFFLGRIETIIRKYVNVDTLYKKLKICV